MVVSLEEAKLYLRIDGDEENTLITSFILAAEEMCEGILRFSLSEFEVIPDTLKNAVFYAVANMYEKREEADMEEVISVVTSLLFPYRKEGW